MLSVHHVARLRISVPRISIPHIRAAALSSESVSGRPKNQPDGFIPDYMLKKVADSEDATPEAREAARRTLESMHKLRAPASEELEHVEAPPPTENPVNPK